jgi:lipid-A-disaccharide synthase
MRRHRILITAGETSSDTHGAGLIAALRAKGVSADYIGIGGSALAAAGMDRIGDSEDLAVVGLFEAISVIPRALRLMNRVRKTLRTGTIDLFIPIDSPDFNLRLVGDAHRAGVRTVYFVAPQLWAWRSGRVKTLQKYVSELLALFPFEADWFTERGVKTCFIGNPKLDAARAYATELRADHTKKTDTSNILLLPGSRRSEIKRHLPILATVAREMNQKNSNLSWRLRMADSLPDSFYQSIVAGSGIELSRAPMTELCHQSDLAVSVSGTASFEVALSGTPCIVIYKMNAISWFIARRIVKVPWASMANIAARREIVPELLQGECEPKQIAALIESLLAAPERLEHMKRDLLSLHGSFGEGDAYARAADRIIDHLEEGSRK